MTMPAISLWQPWASLIAIGAKRYETRSWAPPRRMIGQRIAIHAAKRTSELRDLAEDDDLWTPLAAHYFEPKALPLGAVIGTAILRGAYEMINGTRAVSVAGEIREIPHDPFGDYSPGRWAWRFTDVERVEPPVPTRGEQGFFSWDERSRMIELPEVNR